MLINDHIAKGKITNTIIISAYDTNDELHSDTVSEKQLYVAIYYKVCCNMVNMTRSSVVLQHMIVQVKKEQ